MISYYALLLFLPFFYVLKVMFAYHAKCWLSSKVLCCSPHSNRSHWCSRKPQEMMLRSQLSPWITLKGIQVRTWHPNLIHRWWDDLHSSNTSDIQNDIKQTKWLVEGNIKSSLLWVACYLTHWLPELFAKNTFSAFNKHRRPTKSVGYFAQRSRLLFPLNLSNLRKILWN